MNLLPAKGRFRLEYRGTECLNCGHPLDLSDRYCPNCSQINSIKKISLWDYFEEYMSGVIAYDNRLFRTLTAMVLRPGRITRKYVGGKRMTYTNPFRFLLSLAILYFLLLGTTGAFNINNDPWKRPITDADLENKEISTLNNADTLDIDSLKVNNYKNFIRMGADHDSLVLAAPLQALEKTSDKPFWDRVGNKLLIYNTLVRKKEYREYRELREVYGFPNQSEDRVLFRMTRSSYKAVSEPGEFIQDILPKLPFATFFFLPIFTSFIWITYIRKSFTYTENLIFCFHNQSALFILLIISFLSDLIFGLDTSWLAFLIFAAYLYQAMRVFYGDGWFKTLIKYIFLNTIFVILASLGVIALILGSVLTY